MEFADSTEYIPTGEKVVTIPQESFIVSSPLVSGCVMFGRGKSRCGVLVEPLDPVDPNAPAALTDFCDKIWLVSNSLRHVKPSHLRI